MFRNFLNLLNQPYPNKDDNASIVKGSFTGGFVVMLVLYVFKPFGFDDAGIESFKFALIFGGISFLGGLIFELAVKYLFKVEREKPNWVLWKWILMIILMVLFIAICNFAFVKWYFNNSMVNFSFMLYATFIIGTIPVSIFGTANTIRKLKTNQKIAEEIKPIVKVPIEDIILLPINKSEKVFEINKANTLYVEAMQNYVKIVFERLGKLEKHQLRNTISNIEKELNGSSIIRFHRSFLV